MTLRLKKNTFHENLSKKRSNSIVTLLTLYSRHKGEEEEGGEIGAEGAGEVRGRGRRRWWRRREQRGRERGGGGGERGGWRNIYKAV